jgi:site-specific DNA recombinase
MAKVMLIPAKREYTKKHTEEETPKIRVAAYCRVSTDTDEQATSYEAQVTHYTEYINNNPNWKLAGVYADDGISGTGTKKREEFNKLITACEEGEIDMVITKSISRFARNTLDCLKYVRQLKAKNIPIYFEKENINTLDSKGEVLLTIMASLAQQESQSLSQNVKLGIQYRYQQGKVKINCNHFLGYTKGPDGNLVIVPEEAEIIKRIYREYLEGYSMDKIAAGLEADGLETGGHKTKWHTSSINKILRNEKYMGDALLQKTYTIDFLTKKRIKNNGIVPQYYVEDNHPAIIPKKYYLLVQKELVKRRVVHTSSNGKKRNFSSNHVFANIVYCGNCGEIFRRIHWNNRGCKSIVWRCLSRLEPTSAIEPCVARTVNELTLMDVALKAINNTCTNPEPFIATLQKNIADAVKLSDSASTEAIDVKLEALQKELIKKATGKEDYNKIADEIFRLRELRNASTMAGVTRDEQIKRINDLQDFIKEQKVEVSEFDEALVRRLIEKIMVFDDYFEVEFKSGVKVNIKG